MVQTDAKNLIGQIGDAPPDSRHACLPPVDEDVVELNPRRFDGRCAASGDVEVVGAEVEGRGARYKLIGRVVRTVNGGSNEKAVIGGIGYNKAQPEVIAICHRQNRCLYRVDRESASAIFINLDLSSRNSLKLSKAETEAGRDVLAVFEGLR